MLAKMSIVQWEQLCSEVADAMKIHTRPFVTPLIEDVRGKPPHIGTGTFLQREGIDLLTCEHVARHEPFIHELNGHDKPISLPTTWIHDAKIDASLAAVSENHWRSLPHLAKPLSMTHFAKRHAPVSSELLFFRGIAGQNVYLFGEQSRSIITGYCSQEERESGDQQIFEMLWNPTETTVTSGTNEEVQSDFQHDDPHGFSGSLVWNTRFVEGGCDLSSWTPEKADVTGMLRRYDEKTKTLLALRVEQLLAWL